MPVMVMKMQTLAMSTHMPMRPVAWFPLAKRTTPAMIHTPATSPLPNEREKTRKECGLDESISKLLCENKTPTTGHGHGHGHNRRKLLDDFLDKSKTHRLEAELLRDKGIPQQPVSSEGHIQSAAALEPDKSKDKDKDNDQSACTWGPIFCNRDHFVELHLC